MVLLSRGFRKDGRLKHKATQVEILCFSCFAQQTIHQLVCCVNSRVAKFLNLPFQAADESLLSGPGKQTKSPNDFQPIATRILIIRKYPIGLLLERDGDDLRLTTFMIMSVPTRALWPLPPPGGLSR